MLRPLDVIREMSKVSLLLGHDFLNQAKFPETDEKRAVCLDVWITSRKPTTKRQAEGRTQKPEQRQAYF